MGIQYRELTLGDRKQRVFILEQFLEETAVKAVHRAYKDLPMTLSDSDRPDTGHVKHLKHEFESDCWTEDKVEGMLAKQAKEFLIERGIIPGGIFRIYANCNLHGDFQFAHEDGDSWTALYFVNSKWHEDWGGELMLYPDDILDLAYAISPKPGRMVIFDGMIRHRGGVPSKLCFDARFSLAIKFQK